jgi:hypothetical protein
MDLCFSSEGFMFSQVRVLIIKLQRIVLNVQYDNETSR